MHAAMQPAAPLSTPSLLPAPDAPEQPLLIVGASARAAVASARRSGWAPLAVDLFADVDLRSRASRFVIVSGEHWPGDVAAVAAGLPDGPFLATGGLENHPAVLRELETTRRNLGPSAAAVAAVRDPFALTACLERAGLPCARALRSVEPGVPALVKPVGSCGGRGIRALEDGEPPPASCSYLQRRIDGPSISAVFAGAGGAARLVGVTRQLVGEVALGSEPFVYCGSIVIEPPRALRELLARIGETLAASFALEGLFGVDTVLDGELPRVVEVNPRWVASIEVIERALRPREPVQATLFEGKAILFARSGFRFDASRIPDDLRREIADIPVPGSEISAGAPVLTLFARSGDAESCRERLLERAAVLRELLE